MNILDLILNILVILVWIVACYYIYTTRQAINTLVDDLNTLLTEDLAPTNETDIVVLFESRLLDDGTWPAVKFLLEAVKYEEISVEKAESLLKEVFPSSKEVTDELAAFYKYRKEQAKQ